MSAENTPERDSLPEVPREPERPLEYPEEVAPELLLERAVFMLDPTLLLTCCVQLEELLPPKRLLMSPISVHLVPGSRLIVHIEPLAGARVPVCSDRPHHHTLARLVGLHIDRC